MEVVVDKIKSLLIERKLRPGDLIPSETVLAENLKTSRGSIREAMKILSAYGIVEIRQGQGTFISTAANKKIFDPLLFKILVSDYDYHELIEIRDIMERGVVKLVVANAGDSELEELNGIMDQMDDLHRSHDSDQERWDVLDIAYHRTMGRLAHNEIVHNMYEFIIELFAPTINARLGYHAHRALHLAIVARDLDLAMERLTEHTRTWKNVHHHAHQE